MSETKTMACNHCGSDNIQKAVGRKRCRHVDHQRKDDRGRCYRTWPRWRSRIYDRHADDRNRRARRSAIAILPACDHGRSGGAAPVLGVDTRLALGGILRRVGCTYRFRSGRRKASEGIIQSTIRRLESRVSLLALRRDRRAGV